MVATMGVPLLGLMWLHAVLGELEPIFRIRIPPAYESMSCSGTYFVLVFSGEQNLTLPFLNP